MSDPVSEHLAHHGVKGMKWGVRRKVGKNGRVEKAKGSVDFRTTKDLRTRKAHQLSNMQLKKVNERMQLERKFSDMNPTRAAKGKEFLNDVLKTSVGAAGTAGIIKLATHPGVRATMKKGAEAVTGKAGDWVLKGAFR